MTEPRVAYRTVCYCPESGRFEVREGDGESFCNSIMLVAKVVVKEARKLF